MTLGTDLRYFQINTRQNIHENGTFTFDASETGNDFANFLIGAPNSYTQASLQLQNTRTKYVSLYGQDSFKIKSYLTLNYGLRWEVSQPYYDKQGLLMTFVPGEQSKIFPDSPTGWVFPGDTGIPSTLLLG
jgi:outer membrane receptor protein involved in Fe transport